MLLPAAAPYVGGDTDKFDPIIDALLKLASVRSASLMTALVKMANRKVVFVTFAFVMSAQRKLQYDRLSLIHI